MKHDKKTHHNVTIKKLPGAEIEIAGSIPADVFSAYRETAVKNINGAVKIDGFREGKIPEKVLTAKVGEKTILEEMAELALGEVYPAIVMEHKIDVIGRPQINITKMAFDNPLEFIITTAVMPDVTLGEYKKIAKEVPIVESPKSVEEKEIDEALARVKKMHAGHEGHDEHDGHDHSGHDHSQDDHSGHDHASFDTPEFREKIRSALVENKRMETVEKRRIMMADKIVEASTIELPAILVRNELARIESQFKEDITRMGSNLDDYLKHAKKTIEDLRKEWTPHAEKKAKLQLALNKIAEIEKIQAEEKEIEAEVKHILAHYKDADKDRAYTYAAGVLTNEKVFQFLESLSA